LLLTMCCLKQSMWSWVLVSWYSFLTPEVSDITESHEDRNYDPPGVSFLDTIRVKRTSQRRFLLSCVVLLPHVLFSRLLCQSLFLLLELLCTMKTDVAPAAVAVARIDAHDDELERSNDVNNKAGGAGREQNKLMKRVELIEIAKGVLRGYKYNAIKPEEKTGTPKGRNEALLYQIKRTDALKVRDLLQQGEYVPNSVFTVVVNKQIRELVDSSTNTADSPHLEHYAFKKTGKFFIAEEDLEDFVDAEFSSEDRQKTFFTADTPNHSENGVIAAFVDHAFGLVLVKKSQIEATVASLNSGVSGFSTNDIANGIVERLAGEKYFLKQLQPRLNYFREQWPHLFQKYVQCSESNGQSDGTIAASGGLQRRVQELEGELEQALVSKQEAQDELQQARTLIQGLEEQLEAARTETKAEAMQFKEAVESYSTLQYEHATEKRGWRETLAELRLENSGLRRTVELQNGSVRNDVDGSGTDENVNYGTTAVDMVDDVDGNRNPLADLGLDDGVVDGDLFSGMNINGYSGNGSNKQFDF